MRYIMVSYCRCDTEYKWHFIRAFIILDDAFHYVSVNHDPHTIYRIEVYDVDRVVETFKVSTF